MKLIGGKICITRKNKWKLEIDDEGEDKRFDSSSEEEGSNYEPLCCVDFMLCLSKGVVLQTFIFVE